MVECTNFPLDGEMKYSAKTQKTRGNLHINGKWRNKYVN